MRRSDVVAIGLLVAVVVAAFADVLFAGRTLSAAAYVPGVLPTGPVGAIDPPRPPPVRDVEGAAWVDEPAPYLVHAELAAGRLPLWSQASGLGGPLWGNPNAGVLAPAQLPVNAWPTPLVQDLAWIARVLALGVFAWLLARRLGAGESGAIAAAIAIMLSGQSLEWIVHHPLNTDAFVPLALFAALGLPASGGRGLVLVSVAVAAGCLGLKPQSALVAGVFGLSWLVADGLDRRAASRRDPARAAAAGGSEGREGGGLAARIAGSLAGVALGGALAAVALLPFAETYGQASGLVRAGRSAQSEWAVPLASWPSLIGPWALGGARDAALAAHGAPGLPYAGATVVAAALLGLGLARRRRLAWALAATAGFYLAKAYGLAPVRFAGLPLLGSVNWVKYSFPLYLSLALLAGLAVREIAARQRAAGWLAAAAIAAELLWLAPRERPMRLPPYAPAPWVEALRQLVAERPGRISGPVDLAPPLVSGALGFRDLRAIDVLTPAATWELVSAAIAPSQGVSWILADPDPLLAATSPAAPLADLRWVLSRGPLRLEALPAAVRSLVSARRLARLFAAIEGYRVDSAEVGGGLTELAGDRRFHWTCRTPCRFRFDLARPPATFAVGVAASEPSLLRTRLALRSTSGGTIAEASEAVQVGASGQPWRDVWIAPPAAGEGAGREGEIGPVTIEVALDADEPRSVLVGGIGPSPGDAAERAAIDRELAARAAAFARLRLRFADAVAHVYESPGALGAAAFATEVVRLPEASTDAVAGCIAEHPGAAVACVASDAAAAAGWPVVSSGQVAVLDDRSDAASLATSSSTGGIVLVSRLFYPGWQAHVDGVAAPLLAVNRAFLGVAVPAGEHRVEVRYRPRSVALGGAISLLAAGVCGFLAARIRRPRRI